jgi:hypothetical protein
MRYRVLQKGALIFGLLCTLLAVSFPAFAREGNRPQVYTDPQVYAIYSAVLPKVWLWTQLGATNVAIMVETKAHKLCIPPDDSAKATAGPENLSSALKQYDATNQQPHILERKLRISRDYTLIGRADLDAILRHQTGAWDLFYEDHPGSDGWVQFSAVGFSDDKKTAVVYAAYHCGETCGGGAAYVLQSKGGTWQVTDTFPETCGAPQAIEPMTGFNSPGHAIYVDWEVFATGL